MPSASQKTWSRSKATSPQSWSISPTMAEAETHSRAERIEIRTQRGFQEEFLSTPADIAIGGGAAGAGKSFALLLEAARHVGVRGYGATIFRRTYPQITNE